MTGLFVGENITFFSQYMKLSSHQSEGIDKKTVENGILKRNRKVYQNYFDLHALNIVSKEFLHLFKYRKTIIESVAVNLILIRNPCVSA